MRGKLPQLQEALEGRIQPHHRVLLQQIFAQLQFLESSMQQVLREIELYLDRELDATECAEIEHHLTGCGSCLQRKEFRVSLRELVAKKCGSDPAPGDLLERIRGLLASESG